MRNQKARVGGFAIPQRMTDEWITDRLPTRADGDGDGDVLLEAICYWKPSAEPETTEPDRIAALEQRVARMEATMRQLRHGSRFRLVVEPR